METADWVGVGVTVDGIAWTLRNAQRWGSSSDQIATAAAARWGMQ